MLRHREKRRQERESGGPQDPAVWRTHPRAEYRLLAWLCDHTFVVLLGSVCVLLAAAAFWFPPVQLGAGPPSSASGFFAPGEDKVNINLAPPEELELLPGIGKKRAQAIVEWRERNGPFASLEELLEIPGIGEKTLAEIQKAAVV